MVHLTEEFQVSLTSAPFLSAKNGEVGFARGKTPGRPARRTFARKGEEQMKNFGKVLVSALLSLTLSSGYVSLTIPPARFGER